MVTTLEGLRCLSRKTIWEVSQALQKDIYETLALFRGERQQSLTLSDVGTLARCLEVSIEQVIAAANTSYAVNFYHRLTLPIEETLEACWRREAKNENESEQSAPEQRPAVADRFSQAFELLGLSLEATTEQILQAFRIRVKAASDGKGGYKDDMDRLVQAKELALDFRHDVDYAIS